MSNEAQHMEEQPTTLEDTAIAALAALDAEELQETAPPPGKQTLSGGNSLFREQKHAPPVPYCRA